MNKHSREWIRVSTENNAFQHLDVIKRNRKKRRQYQEIFVEGVASINALIETNRNIITVAFSGDRPLSNWAKSVIEQAKPKKIYQLTPELMSLLSDRNDPSELIATAQLIEHSLADIQLTQRLFALVFERPANPGNLGSLIRSCDAFDVDGIITTGHSVDIYDPAVIRSSVGAIFHRHVIHVPSATQLEGWITHIRNTMPEVKIIGTKANASRIISETSIAPPLVIVLGNEGHGMGERLDNLVDFDVAIPIKGNIDSLNVACAGSILLYEIRRKNRFENISSLWPTL